MAQGEDCLPPSAMTTGVLSPELTWREGERTSHIQRGVQPLSPAEQECNLREENGMIPLTPASDQMYPCSCFLHVLSSTHSPPWPIPPSALSAAGAVTNENLAFISFQGPDLEDTQGRVKKKWSGEGRMTLGAVHTARAEKGQIHL